MHILVDENIPQGLDVFSAYGQVRLFAGRSLRHEDVGEAEALLVRSITKVNAELLEGTPIRFVGTATIGVDHVNQEYLRKAGIGFASAPGCNARSVAEYLVAALLHLRTHRGLTLEGKTLGIVGFGHVGNQVAKVAPHLGLKVLLCDPPLEETGHPGPFVSLKELIARSDILTAHVPLTEDGPHPTLRLFNRALFETFDEPKVLVNTCRGEVIDEEGLFWALNQGKLSHLVLDVFPGEPDVNPILGRQADLITPHIAGYSVQGKLNGTGQILDAFCRHFGLEKKVVPNMPSPPHPVMVWPKGVDVEAGLNFCVRQCYDILRDDINLRRSLGDAEFPKIFDALRKNYAARYEFAGYRIVELPSSEINARKRLRGLGFVLE
jgi:erythronate-4-phosphate dehydrogenase